MPSVCRSRGGRHESASGNHIGGACVRRRSATRRYRTDTATTYFRDIPATSVWLRNDGPHITDCNGKMVCSGKRQGRVACLAWPSRRRGYSPVSVRSADDHLWINCQLDFGVLWPEIYGVASLGAIRSIAEATGVFATAAGPGLTGTLIDLGISLPTQMIFYGGYCLLGTAAMMIVSTQLQRRG